MIFGIVIFGSSFDVNCEEIADIEDPCCWKSGALSYDSVMKCLKYIDVCVRNLF